MQHSHTRSSYCCIPIAFDPAPVRTHDHECVARTQVPSASIIPGGVGRATGVAEGFLGRRDRGRQSFSFGAKSVSHS